MPKPLKEVPAIKIGMYALDKIAQEIFNIMCIPAAAKLTAGYDKIISNATTYCEAKRAFLIIDIPNTVTTNASMHT